MTKLAEVELAVIAVILDEWVHEAWRKREREGECKRANKDITLHSFPKEPLKNQKYVYCSSIFSTHIGFDFPFQVNGLVNGFRFLEEPLYWLKVWTM
ncbi:hypothetical protein QE152_g29189 [Popillia japonica]|uniref:Uncharacterized protein n=1 Tax=Popillia japonica TaxID=7064 RepID=A0AAW1JIV6_POPJA